MNCRVGFAREQSCTVRSLLLTELEPKNAPNRSEWGILLRLLDKIKSAVETGQDVPAPRLCRSIAGQLREIDP